MRAIVVAAAATLLAAGLAQANVTIPTVRVGDPGNVGELSGGGAGGYGPDRVCGAVSYTYSIGTYEVTAGQYTAFLNAVAATDTYGLYSANMWSSAYGCKIQQNGTAGSYTYTVASDYANRPVNYVSWGDAARFANWLHNNQPTGAQDLSTTEDGAYYLNGAATNAALMAVSRKADWKWAIPSEDEWYKAAYYKGGSTNAGYWDYATRSDAIPGQDMNDVSGNNANFSISPYAYPIDSGKYYTTVAGEFQDSKSAYGTFDQCGNVWEMNEATMTASARGIRGGSYEDTFTYAYMQAAFRLASFTPTGEVSGLGFRVASQVPEPASMSLLILGGLAVLRRRKHSSPV